MGLRKELQALWQLQKTLLEHLRIHGPAQKEGLSVQFIKNGEETLQRALQELLAWKLVTADSETINITELGIQKLNNPTYWA